MEIKINDLKSSEASLLADKESFLGEIRDLSTEELTISGGGGYGKGHSGGSRGRSGGKGHSGGSRSNSGSHGYCYCYH